MCGNKQGNFGSRQCISSIGNGQVKGYVEDVLYLFSE